MIRYIFSQQQNFGTYVASTFAAGGCALKYLVPACSADHVKNRKAVLHRILFNLMVKGLANMNLGVPCLNEKSDTFTKTLICPE